MSDTKNADVSYEIVQDDMVVAGTSGPGAEREILHYASQYGQDFPIEIFKVTREPVTAAQLSAPAPQKDTYLRDRINQAETMRKVLQAQIRDKDKRIAELEAENAGLLLANRDCIDHFTQLKEDYDRLLSVPVAQGPAIERFKECRATPAESPWQQLKFFCSLAMNGQDWLDSEPFFAAVEAQLAAPVAAQEPVAWRCSAYDGGRWVYREYAMPVPAWQPLYAAPVTAPVAAPAQEQKTWTPEMVEQIHRDAEAMRAKFRPGRVADEPAQEPIKLTECRHCGFRVALNESPQDAQPAQGERKP